MKQYNISINRVAVIKNLHEKATSAVLFNSSLGDWFRTIVGVRQESLLSPTLFNIFLERIMTDTLEDHEGTASTGGRAITNLRFADDIDGLAGEEKELKKLVEHLDKASTTVSPMSPQFQCETNGCYNCERERKKGCVTCNVPEL